METPNVTRCEEVEPMLTPYADGEATDEIRGSVEQHVHECPPCGRRLSAERSGRAVVRARRAILRAPAPAALRARCASAAARRPVLRRWVPLSLAASLLLAVAGAFVYSLSDPIEVLAAEIAIDHLKCFTLQDTAAVAEPAELVRNWERDEGWRLPVAPGVPGQGIRLVGLRHCLSTKGRMAHLLYMAEAQPVSVYVWRSGGLVARRLEVLGQTAVIWSRGGRTYAVIGHVEPGVLSRVADQVRQAAE